MKVYLSSENSFQSGRQIICIETTGKMTCREHGNALRVLNSKWQMGCSCWRLMQWVAALERNPQILQQAPRFNDFWGFEDWGS